MLTRKQEESTSGQIPQDLGIIKLGEFMGNWDSPQLAKYQAHKGIIAC